jgi:hypothetical protein
MPLLSLAYPLINGMRHDYSSVEFNINGVRFNGVKSISYRHSLDPGVLRGNRAGIIGRTRGIYNAEGSIELYRQEYETLITTLVLNPLVGYFESQFDIVVSYSETFTALLTDKLIGCRLKSSENSHAEGNDPLSVSCDLSIMYLSENGKFPVSPSQLVK